MTEQALYTYRVSRLLGNYDGDTIDVIVDLGLRVSLAMRLRLYGIDTPELRGDDKERGQMVRDYVKNQLTLADEVLIRTYKDKTGKFGRWLAVVYTDGVNLNQELLDLGFAVEFMKTEPWPEELA